MPHRSRQRHGMGPMIVTLSGGMMSVLCCGRAIL